MNTLYAQQPFQLHVQTLNINDGLSSRFVQSKVYQDNKGFIWIPTNMGIDRFDGNEFRNYDFSKVGNIYSPFELAIVGEFNGKIWIQLKTATEMLDTFLIHNYELYILDPLTSKITSLKEEYKNLSGHFPDQFTSVFQDHNNVFWLGTKNGELFKFDGLLKKVYDNKNKAPITFANYDIDSLLWIADPIQLISLDTLGNMVNNDKLLGSNDVTIRLSNGSDIIILKDRAKKISASIIIKTKSHPAVTFPYNKGSFKRYGFILDIDKYGRIWLMERGILQIFNKDGTLLADMSEVLQKKVGFFHPIDIYFDSNGQAWISTFGESIYIINLKESYFQNFLQFAPPVSCRQMLDYSKDHILLVSYKGVFLFNKNTGSSILVADTKNGYGIIKTSDGYFWIGLHGKKILRMSPDLKEQKTFNYTSTENYLQTQFLVPFESKSGKFWIGCTSGLIYKNQQNDSLIFYKKYNSFKSQQFKRIRHFYENEEGIWIATENGLLLLDEQKGIIAHFNNFPNNNLTFLFEDNEGIFWIATKLEGLLRWNRQDQSIKQYLRKNSFSKTVITSIYEDDNRFLWLPSNYGLMRFDKKNETVNTFFTSDGIAHNEFNYCSNLYASDKKFYFGGLNGVTTFNPIEVDKVIKENQGKIQVTKFQILDNTTGTFIDHTEKLNTEKEIQITPQINSVQIDLTLIDYRRIGQNKYAYKIEGRDPDWNYLLSNNFRISGLAYGEYKLLIKAQGGGGNWSTEILQLPLKVIKPFYLTWPFFILAFLTFIFTIFLFIQQHTRNLRLAQIRLEKEVNQRTHTIQIQKEELETLNNTKDRLFTIIAHDLRGPIVHLQGISKKISWLLKKGDLKRAEIIGQAIDDSSSRVNTLLDNLLQWSLIETSRLPNIPQQFNLFHALKDVLLIVSPLAEQKKQTITIKIPENALTYADRNAISTVLRNLIGNAIKFTPENGLITISTEEFPDKIEIKVSDTGIGMGEEKIKNIFSINDMKKTEGTLGEKGTGIGLNLCYELLKVNNTTITIKSQLGKGSVFSFFLPKSRIVEKKSSP